MKLKVLKVNGEYKIIFYKIKRPEIFFRSLELALMVRDQLNFLLMFERTRAPTAQNSNKLICQTLNVSDNHQFLIGWNDQYIYLSVVGADFLFLTPYVIARVVNC